MTDAPPRALRWSLFVPVTIAVLAYLWVLRGWFLYDDFTQGYLLEHDAPGIDGNWGPILRDFGRAQFGIADWVYYRAMMSVYLTACLELLGVDPVKLHAVNLCHHAVLTGMVAMLCGLLCRSRPNVAAICGGTWFALHPVGVEAIAWFSANTVTFELLARLGAILMFALHVHGRGGRWTLGLSMLLAAVGLLTKESGINVVLGLVAVHLLRTPTPGLGELVLKHLPFVPIWIGYFVLRRVALGMFLAGSKGHAGTFLEAVPQNAPIQAKLVFVPFGGALPDGLLLAAGTAFLAWVLLRGLSSRDGLFVLAASVLWLASQFVPTALNHVYPNLGSSRAHYGTVSSAALCLAVLVFGRRGGSKATLWTGAALFGLVIGAFFPARNVRQDRFQEAWEENRRIHGQLVAHAERATPAQPAGVVSTPYDHDGVPQLNRTAHFTLCEVPFVPRDLPVVGLTTLLVHGGLVDQNATGGVEWSMKHDTSPLRAVFGMGGTLLAWQPEKQSFLVQRRGPPRPMPAIRRAESGAGRFELGRELMPHEIEAVELRASGRPSGGLLSWGGPPLRFGGGRASGGETSFTIDLTHDLGFWVTSVAGGIDRFDVRLDGYGPAERLSMRLVERLPELALRGPLRGREIVFGREHEHLTAPALPDPQLRLRLVLLAPSEPIDVPEVEPGRPVTFPRRLDSELTRLMRLSRQKRFYYYFEARSPEDRAIGGARSRVDWFRLVPERPQ